VDPLSVNHTLKFMNVDGPDIMTQICRCSAQNRGKRFSLQALGADLKQAGLRLAVEAVRNVGDNDR
jgi:hypothetical protein